MSDISAAQLARVTTFPKLIDLLRDKLDWPIDEGYGFEEIVYEYDAGDLGLKADEIAKVREIHQLRPLVTGQPWGIFFISFEEKNISVTVLRRLLRALVVKKRVGAQTPDLQAWHLHDLIFVTNFGRSGHREIAFAHFSDTAGDLPVLNVLGWNAKDTKLHNDYVGQVLGDRLRWPGDPANQQAWRETWGAAFELRLGEVARTSQDLARQLASLASNIRASANELLAAETASGTMRKMLDAFRRNLIHDLDEDGFADMFAQTISYGLLAAKISRPGADLVADNLADMVPKTNPFLKELFASFLSLGGRDARKGMDFDELGVRDVVNLLNRAHMDAVLRDFGNRNPKKDPVIHFYEDFLSAYDKDQKVDAGIFYTPPAVVGFIVRGVDEILRTEFDLPLGLADTTTWAQLSARIETIKVPPHVNPDMPFVQILDPATGTGTFLVEIIDLIHKRMEGYWQAEGLLPREIQELWNAYVPKHLLPRITAFELKMAPYAIAHMKVGLKLVETGYTFGSDERAHILLSNSLQPAKELDLEQRMRLEALAHEAQRANEAKDKTPFTVVIGNPPYKGHSENPSKIKGKLTYAGELVQRFFQVRGEPLNERNPKWLNNDYVKFIAFAMSRIERSGTGVIGYITSNSWLDGPTFRGMRTDIVDTFSQLRILNLHGNVSLGETASDGTRDEGVFQISEGTSIMIGAAIDSNSSILQHDLVGILGTGSDEGKLAWLERATIAEGIVTPIAIDPPIFQLIPSSGQNKKEFYSGASIREVMPVNSVGFATANDDLTIHFTRQKLASILDELVSLDLAGIERERTEKLLPHEWRVQYDVGEAALRLRNKPEARDWRLEWAIEDLKQFPVDGRPITQVLYRPFDVRWTLYTGHTKGFICMPRAEVMNHVLDDDNIALITSRMTKGEEFAHVHATFRPAEVISLSPKTSNNAFVYPLWIRPQLGEVARRPNLNPAYVSTFSQSLKMSYDDGLKHGHGTNIKADLEPERNERASMSDSPWDGRGDLLRTFGPRDLFDWIFAVLHSPIYRVRYAEFLKSDYPRIPTPKDRETFAAIVPSGRALAALHLLKTDEVPMLESPEIRFAGRGEARVERGYPRYENGKVMINESRWFEDVPRSTWAFQVGGYQVCEKWLKDRAAKGGQNPSPGLLLTDEDILQYRRVVTALTEIRRLMTEIDQVIDEHGGWPGAFRTDT